MSMHLHHPSLSLGGKRKGKVKFRNAEEAKKALGSQNLFNESLNGIPLAISKQKFEELIQPKLAETLACCLYALRDANLKAENIDEVIMVGGSTRTPAVKQAVAAFFGKPVHDELNPDEVVALCAAIQSDIFDHLLACLPEFGLNAFQQPTGRDFRALNQA